MDWRGLLTWLLLWTLNSLSLMHRKRKRIQATDTAGVLRVRAAPVTQAARTGRESRVPPGIPFNL